MNWIYFGILSLIFTSSFNIIQLVVSKSLNNQHLDHIFIRFSFIILGLISAISFFIPGFRINRNLLNIARREINPFLVFGTALSLYLATTFKLFSFGSGSSLSLVIISLNIIVTILFGYLFLKENINLNIVIAIIIYISTGIYIIYSKQKITNLQNSV